MSDPNVRPDPEKVATGLRSLADQIARGESTDRILFAAERFLELAAQHDGGDSHGG